MSYRNLASMNHPASSSEEPTFVELKDNVASFLAKSKAKAEAEDVEEFWNEIKSEGKMLGLAYELEMKARAEKEARVAREAIEAIEAIEANEAKERQGFWNKIQREAVKYTSSDKAKEIKEEREIREIEEKKEFWRNIHKEAEDLALREERTNELKEKHMDQIKLMHELSKKEPIDYRIRSSSPQHYIIRGGYKRKSKHYKSKHYKSKHYKKNRRIHKKTKKHVS